jgi:PAS domain S-box-containing protein
VREELSPALQQEIELLTSESSVVPAGLVVHAGDGRLLFCNERASQLLGLTREQLAGREKTDPYWRFVHADGNEMDVGDYPVSRVGRTRAGIANLVMGIIRGRDEVPVWVQVNAQPHLGADGAIERIVVSFIDVTGFKENQQRLQLALDAADMGDWNWDFASDQVKLSARAAAILGTEPMREMTWTSLRTRLHPDDSEIARAAVDASLADGSDYRIEYRVMAGGAARWVEAQGRPVYGEGRRPVGMIGVVQDTTGRRKQQEAAREESEVLEVLNQTAALIASELDLDKLLQGVTDAATKLTGARFGAFFYNGVDEQGDAYLLYTLSGAPRSAFDSFGHPRATPVFEPTFNGEPVVRMADVLVDPRYGRWKPHHGMPPGHLPVRSYLAVSVTSRRGDVIGGLFFGHPEPGKFTERAERLALGIAVQAGTAIDNARLYREAQAVARERDRLLESERAARGQAEAANRLKDQFLATLSHELRTPLSAVMGWLDILRRKGTADEAIVNRGLAVIERSTRAQHQLVEDLLDMSRITAGKMSLAVSPVVPATFVQGAIDVVQPAAADAGVAVHLEDRCVDCVVDGDPDRLQQVVWNLLANAVKFTPRGGRIDVSCDCTDRDVRVRVADTGAGIDPESLKSIFEPFRQADGSTARQFRGLGLGLALVRELVSLHGGTVAATSEGLGQGATFTVQFPLSGATLPPSAEQQAGDMPNLLGQRIVLVEDDEGIREFLARLLQDAGAYVTSCGSVAEAEQVLSAAGADCLISDIGLPGADGYQLARWLRQQQPPLRDMPAIALTAFARDTDAKQALRSGFHRHMAKPIQPAALIRLLADLHRTIGSGRSCGRIDR